MKLKKFNVNKEEHRLNKKRSFQSNIRVRTIVLSVFILVGSIMLFTYSKFTTTVNVDVIHAKVGQFVFRLNYDANGGTVSPTYKDIKYKEAYGELPIATRLGYVQNGWWTDKTSGEQVTPSTEISGSDKTIYAHWIKGKYDLVVKPNTGEWETHTSDQTYNLEYEEIKNIADPTKEGFTFTGWSLNGSGSTYNNSTKKFKMGYENATLEANYSINTYTLTINLDDGSTPSDYELDYGETKTLPVPTKEGYTFTGWNNTTYINDGVYTQPASDVTLKATWRVNDYKWIVYHKKMDLNGSTYTLSDTDEGEGAYDTNFSGTLKTYNGFNKPATQTKKIKVENNYPPTTNVINYNYSRNKYKLTVKPNGGSYAGSTNNAEYNMYYDETKTISNPTRTCYTFNNWTKSGNSTLTNGILKMGTEATSLTANWTLITYTITFDPNGGSFTNSSDGSKTVNCNGTLTLPTPNRPEYSFEGWFTSKTGGTQVTNSTVWSSSQTVYAHWTSQGTYLTFNYNGGSGSVSSRQLTNGEAYGELPTATYSGYDFKGWYTAQTGGDRVDENTLMGSSSTIIYAHWKTHYTSLSQVSYMQDMNSDICSSMSTGTSKTLTDSRDSSTYRVTKLADGKCWMTQNLKILNKTITPDNSNTKTNWTIPAATSTAWTGYSDNRTCYHSSYGGYYTYYTTSGGTVDDTVTSGNINYDICPNGWRVPTSQEYSNLFTVYNVTNDRNGFNKLRSSPLYFDISAQCNYSSPSVNTSGWNANFWTGTVASSINSYELSYWSVGYGPLYAGDKRMAYALRCVVK